MRSAALVSTPSALALALCAVAELIACGGPSSELTVYVHGPAYPRPRCAKGKASKGLLLLRGTPVAGAQVRLSPGGKRARTDARGRAVFRGVAPGRFYAQVFAGGYRIEPSHALRYRGGKQTTEVTLHPCISLGRNRLAVGFDSYVTVAARNLCGRPWTQIERYRWRQLEGPKVEAIVSGFAGARLRLRTPPLTALRELPKTPQILSFSHAQTGELVYELQATNARGEVSTSRVMVSATSLANGMTSVAPYNTYYFAGEPKGPWAWRLTKIPKGWNVALRGGTTRTPAVRAVPPGPVSTPQVVELENEPTGLRFSIVLGNWNTVRRDCGRSECHRSLEAAWRTTPHAQAWRRLIDGELEVERSELAPSCADCHAIGYNPIYDSGGYDDVAKRHKVALPLSRKKGNYAALPQALKDVSNVYCLGCHGPGRLDPPIAEQPGLFGTGVCARCHDRPPEHTLVAQWRTTKHAKTITDEVNGPDKRPACARCHTAQGFVYGNFALARPHSSKTAVLNCCETTQPITCQACHNPMRPTPRKQVYRFGSVETASGLKLERVGSGALCMSCHNAGVDTQKPETLRSRRAPHAPQADLTYGRAGFVLKIAGSPLPPPLKGRACAKKTRDGCVTCHMHSGPKRGQKGHQEVGSHTFRLVSKKTKDGKPAAGAIQNIAACRSCHAAFKSFNDPAKGDYDGDGKVEGVRDEVRGLSALLAARLRRRIATRRYKGCDEDKSLGVDFARGGRETIVIVDAAGKDLGDCDRNGAIERAERPFTFPEPDVRLHKAAFNYLVVTLDRSDGLHNYPYTVKLLQRTIRALGGRTPRWTPRR